MQSKGPSSQGYGLSSRYGCESWTIKKAEHRRIDAFELWCWRRFLSWWWTGRPGMLQSMGSQRVGHNWATELNWKTAKSYYYIPIRMVQIQNTGYTDYWQRCGAIGTLSHSWSECKMLEALWKTIWSFLTGVNRLLSYSSAIAPLGIYSSELKIYVYTKTRTQMFNNNFIHNC